MIQLTNRELAVLREMARSFVDNLVRCGGSYYWATGATLFEAEVDLLKKLSGDFDEFRRQVYLASEPSVDITKVESVDCRKHKIFSSDYVRIRKQFGISPLDANSWMLCSGPKIID